jgi:hypothetical protein
MGLYATKEAECKRASGLGAIAQKACHWGYGLKRLAETHVLGFEWIYAEDD